MARHQALESSGATLRYICCERRIVYRLAAGVATAMILAALALATPAQPVAGAQSSSLITVDMIDAVEDAGSVALSVTYRTSSILPVDGAMSGYLAGLEFERAAVLASLPDADLEVLQQYRAIPALEIRVSSIAALRALAANPAIETIVRPPEEISFGQATDAVLALDQARPALEVELMHSLGFRGQGTTIAILDTGIEPDNPWLRDSVSYERCFASCASGLPTDSGPGTAFDLRGHGTMVASVIASNGDGEAQLGIAPDANLEIYQMVTLPNATDALDYILANRSATVDVINMSWVTPPDYSAGCPRDAWPPLYDVLTALNDRGVVLVMATGNNALAATGMPACFDIGVTVGGTENADPAIYSRSNLTRDTDVTAPARSISTIGLDGFIAERGGTSFASPIVAACAALIAQSGAESATAIEARLASGTQFTTGFGHAVPWVTCGPECQGSVVTVLLAAGDTPTEGDDVIIGTEGADRIDAMAGNDVICGLGGDDYLLGGDGDDIISGGPGVDRLFGGKGADEMYGGDGDDVLHGNRGADSLWGQAGDDRLFGYSQNDELHGGQGNDNLHGNTGDDFVNGGDGSDKLFGYADDDQLVGGNGDDLVVGNFGDDTLAGNDGDDLLRGSDGEDFLEGRDGNDVLEGNSGPDVLLGGNGDDHLDGGIGDDLCQGDAGTDTATRCERVNAVP